MLNIKIDGCDLNLLCSLGWRVRHKVAARPVRVRPVSSQCHQHGPWVLHLTLESDVLRERLPEFRTTRQGSVRVVRYLSKLLDRLPCVQIDASA